jgi:hypothetical protein
MTALMLAPSSRAIRFTPEPNGYKHGIAAISQGAGD